MKPADSKSSDSTEMPIHLQEVDSLEAIVIIDNELDPLSPAAPNTVEVSGSLGAIAMGSKHTLTDRGEACKELRLEDVCCAAHGLSILVVRQRSTIRLLYAALIEPILDCHQRQEEARYSLRRWSRRGSLGEECETPATKSLLRGSDSALALASRPFRFVIK